LNAITTYGHESVSLEPLWQMVGALEALNGMLLFGLTIAFLFAMVQEVRPRLTVNSTSSRFVDLVKSTSPFAQ
jgi:hypothetical protein